MADEEVIVGNDTTTDDAFSGVFPCYEGLFKVKVNDSYVDIADLETFTLNFDNGVEEWTPYGSEGWKRRLMTAKSVTISISGKRNVGDTGNDFIAGLAFKNGRDAEADFKIAFKNGDEVVLGSAVISVTVLEYGDSTNVAPLEFEVQSNGKPTITTADSSDDDDDNATT
jgi:predicted secreted protein